MKREQVLRILREHQTELDTFGVRRLVLFGSVARDEARPGSDVDLLVEFERPTGLFGLFALQNWLTELLGCPVDLGTTDSLKDRYRSRVFAESIDVA